MVKADLSNKGQRVRDFFNSECKSLISVYKNIETLIPAEQRKGAAHTGEEGRYIESILRAFLNKHLPKELEALSGFILRPATKVGKHNRQRRKTEEDRHSNQLDIIIYDSTNYPVYERFEEFVVVPPEGVISIISVKKNLYENQIESEFESLKNAARLCSIKNQKGDTVIGPTTSLISFSNMIKPEKSHQERCEWLYSKVKSSYNQLTFDECVGQVICLDAYSIFKTRPNSESKFNKEANYVGFEHGDEEHLHFGLQFLLTGIFASYYHPSRNEVVRPGFTSFPTNKKHDIELGPINVSQLRLKNEY
ncbi:MAG: hypothetical protein RLO81_01570 [Fulvivirga sp.]|uniref:DUF6602 domain-containing protein n=1 Tax=Fulvivirga sp. TaxID=1931237 RepID=UPI0032F01E10